MSFSPAHTIRCRDTTPCEAFIEILAFDWPLQMFQDGASTRAMTCSKQRLHWVKRKKLDEGKICRIANLMSMAKKQGVSVKLDPRNQWVFVPCQIPPAWVKSDWLIGDRFLGWLPVWLFPTASHDTQHNDGIVVQWSLVTIHVYIYI